MGDFRYNYYKTEFSIFKSLITWLKVTLFENHQCKNLVNLMIYISIEIITIK